MVVVSDTSAISNLYQVHQLDLLEKLYGEILIPSTVERELYSIPSQESLLETFDWIKVAVPSNQKLVYELSQKLDLGESEAIALALEKNADYLLIDEYAGRSIADDLGLKIVGVLGILIQAKQENYLQEIGPVIRELKEIGFRLSDSLVDIVLKKIGEM
jgi:predicted nucleic acid-binding protein